MIGSAYLGFAAVALASFASASAVEEDWVLSLLKRQEPGTPLYACHDNCGRSITLSRGASPCTDDAFLTGYAYCLTCSGPEDFNIWRYYGATLTVAGTKCGLSTTPGTPTESEPEPVTTSSTTTTSAPTTTPPTTTTPEPTPTPSPEPEETPVETPVTVSETFATASNTSSVPASTTSSATFSPTPTVAPSGTAPVGTGSSGTATSTPPAFTGAANARHVVGMGALGVAVLAMLV